MLFGCREMERQKEEIIDVSKKIVENINSMSFVSFDDEQVRSLMMIRELARGIIDNKVVQVKYRTYFLVCFLFFVF